MYVLTEIFWTCTALIVAVKNTGNKVTLFRKHGVVKSLNHMKCKEGRKKGRKEDRKERERKNGAQGKKSLLNYVGYKKKQFNINSKI